jgi:hypothetical protein
MNLFYLDEDLDKCAEYHVDAHVTKMQLEAAQMLCTNLWIDLLFGYVPRAITKEENKILSATRVKQSALPLEERTFPYLPTMQNHPCTIWMRTSLDNFEWSHCYANALSSEQHYRYGTTHKSITVINSLPDPKHIPSIGFTKFGLAMPDQLKNYDDPIGSYRMYYMLDKGTFAKWKYRDKPKWWDESIVDYQERITRKK